MKRLKHPHINDLFINVDEERVAAHVAAGWLIDEPKPKRKSVKDDANKQVEEPANEAPSTGDGEAE